MSCNEGCYEIGVILLGKNIMIKNNIYKIITYNLYL